MPVLFRTHGISSIDGKQDIGHCALISLFNSQKNPHYPHPTNEKTETKGCVATEAKS